MKPGDLVYLNHNLKAEGITGFWGRVDGDDHKSWIENGATAIVIESEDTEHGFHSIIQVLCGERIVYVPAANVRVISD
jgi:hypothetical protein